MGILISDLPSLDTLLSTDIFLVMREDVQSFKSTASQLASFIGAMITSAVISVSNSDNTLAISPNSGAVIASLNLNKANTWIGIQTLTTPILGVASATSINKVAITAPASGATLTITDGKTLTVSNNATISGTNTGDIANTALTTGTLAQFASTTSSQLIGVISDPTGTGSNVFATSPVLTTPNLKVTDTGTNAVVNVGTLTHNSSGTIIAGFGVGVVLNGQSDTTADRAMGAINATWTTVTDGSRSSQLQLQTVSNAGSLSTGLTVGSGIGGATAGLIVGGYDASFGGIWQSGITPSTSNYSFLTSSSTVDVNASTQVQIQIGTTTKLTINSSSISTVARITTTITDAGTTNVVTAKTISHDSSGTAAAGFGVGIAFNSQDSTTADQNLAAINATWLVATHASRSSQIQFQTVSNAGALSTALVIGSGISGATAAGLTIGGRDSSSGGIWGSSVTPSATNYAFVAIPTNTIINVPSAGTVSFGVNNSLLFNLSSTTVTCSLPYTTTITSVATGTNDGLVVTNSTAAAAGAQQYSPIVRRTGQGWKTTATAASQTCDWIDQCQPVQGTTAPTANLVFSSQVAGGGYTSGFAITNVLGGTGYLIAGGSGTSGTIWTSLLTPSSTNYALSCSNTSTAINCTSGGNVSLGINNANSVLVTSNSVQLFFPLTKYNNIATAGIGVPAIYASANITAQSSNATITNYTAPAADGNYEVSASVNVSVATGISTSVNVTYTDVGNNVRTLILPVQQAGGTGGTYLTNGLIIATGDYSTPVHKIRVKASTAITVLLASGTFTGVTWSGTGTIKQTA